MNTYLVTGGAGFIGSHLIDALLERGERVVCLDNFNDYYDPTLKRANTARHMLHRGYRLVEGDIRDRVVVPRLMKEFKPQTVIHLAACAGVRPSLLDPFKYQSVNLDGTLNMLEAARQAGVEMFVNASSSSVYGENLKAPFEEGDPLLTPASPYAATKLGAEGMVRVYARQYAIHAVSLRFFTVYGPRQRPDMAITKFASKILRGEPITVYGDGSARRDFTYIADIVSGIVGAAAYRGSEYEPFNLGSGTTVTLQSVIQGLEQAIGRPAQRIYADNQPGDVPLTCSNIDKARRLLGYEPKTQLDAGLPQVVRFVRAALDDTAKQRVHHHRGATEWGQSTTA